MPQFTHISYSHCSCELSGARRNTDCSTEPPSIRSPGLSIKLTRCADFSFLAMSANQTKSLYPCLLLTVSEYSPCRSYSHLNVPDILLLRVQALYSRGNSQTRRACRKLRFNSEDRNDVSQGTFRYQCSSAYLH